MPEAGLPLPEVQTHYDVVIVGAGMVGASLSCALTRPASQGQSVPRVLLVEAASISLDGPAVQPGFDGRSTVLSASSRDCLEQLSLWPQIREAAEPITRILVSDQGHFGTVRMTAEEAGVEALGYVAENAALGRAFNARLLDNPAFTLCANAEVQTLRCIPGGMQLQISRGGELQTLTAALVVLAEGGRSSLPAQLGIVHQRETYQQSAVIANVAFTRPHEGRAWERFTAKGPLALLPLGDLDGQHRAALVWTQPADQAEAVLQLPDAAFLARLEGEFGNKLGPFIRVGKRALYPLNLSVASEQIRPGLVLLGNVAHTLHPVAGQGFNLALRDTIALAASTRSAIAAGDSPGSFSQLQRYLDHVRADQLSTIDFSHYMTRLFSSRQPALTWLRQWGMASLDLASPLRHSLGQKAMGYHQPRVQL